MPESEATRHAQSKDPYPQAQPNGSQYSEATEWRHKIAQDEVLGKPGKKGISPVGTKENSRDSDAGNTHPNELSSRAKHAGERSDPTCAVEEPVLSAPEGIPTPTTLKTPLQRVLPEGTE